MAFKANQSSKQAAQQRNGKPLHPAMSTGVSAGRRGLEPQLQSMGYEDGASALSPANNALSPRNVQAYGGKTNEADVQNAAAGGVRGASAPLPYLDTIQSAFGKHDVSGVQCAVGGAAQTACESMGAEAYATGNTVAFKGATSLHTAAHEAAHIVQQRGGVSLKGGVGQAGDPYEQHADAVADLVVQGKSAESVLDQYAGGGSARAGVQSKVVQRRAAGGGGRTTNADGTYTVVSGDTLSAIAQDLLGDAMAYPDIHAANPDVISNPNVIDVGWRLHIPNESTTDTPLPEAEPSSNLPESEYSGDIPIDYRSALDRHAANVQRLYDALQHGLACRDNPDATRWGVVWPNTCEWLNSGAVRYLALTPTHDAPERGLHNPYVGNAYFGWDFPVPAISNYNEHDLTDTSNIMNGIPYYGGFWEDNLYITDPVRLSQTDLIGTIVHECQHVLDHEGNDAIGQYRSEFNSRWIDRGMDIHSEAPGSATDPATYDNARQEAIRAEIYDSEYAWMLANWDTNPAFKSQALAYTRPETCNPVNSARIEMVWMAIESYEHDQLSEDTQDKLLRAATRLRTYEQEAICAPTAQGRWLAHIDASVSSTHSQDIKEMLGL